VRPERWSASGLGSDRDDISEENMTESMPIVNQAAVTMSSREIAELVGSNHSDVKRSARRLADDGILTQPLAEFPFEHNGNTYMEMRFNKRDSLVLVARL
jgi:phage regulator Rha-like protein